MQDIENRIKNLIDSLEFRKKELLNSNKDSDELKEIDLVLNRVKDLYQAYLEKDGALKHKVALELVAYVRSPIFMRIIRKCNKGIAAFMMFVILFLASACNSKNRYSDNNNDNVIIGNTDNYHFWHVKFVNFDGSVEHQEVLNYSFLKPKIVKKVDGHKFLGWFLNGQLYDFNTPVQSDLELEARWIPEKYPNIKALSDSLENLVRDLGLNGLISSNAIDDFILVGFDIQDLGIILDILEKNKVLGYDVVVDCKDINLNNYKLLANLPREFFYWISISDDFSNVNLGEYLQGLKINTFVLDYNANVSESDLKKLLQVNGLNLKIYSKVFDKYAKLSTLASNSNRGLLSLSLNANANEQEVVLPNYEIVFVSNSNDVNANVVFQNGYVLIDYENMDNLNVAVPDKTVVRICCPSFEDIGSLENLFKSPIFTSLNNMGMLEVFCFDFYARGEITSEGITMYDNNGIKLGYFDGEKYHKVKYYARTLQ